VRCLSTRVPLHAIPRFLQNKVRTPFWQKWALATVVGALPLVLVLVCSCPEAGGACVPGKRDEQGGKDCVNKAVKIWWLGVMVPMSWEDSS
jgi:hypothetical protein